MGQRKSREQFQKTRREFTEAETVWNDYFYVDLFDDEHSIEENRFLIIGESKEKRLLIISYTERENRFRIISAGELTAKKRKDYEHGHFE